MNVFRQDGKNLIDLWLEEPKGADAIELAWAAGFFDGEGYFGVHRLEGGWKLRMGIQQLDGRPLARFCLAIGWSGKIYLRENSGLGRNPLHGITISHRDTQMIADLLWPYLSEPKKEQYLRAVEEIRRYKEKKQLARLETKA